MSCTCEINFSNKTYYAISVLDHLQISQVFTNSILNVNREMQIHRQLETPANSMQIPRSPEILCCYKIRNNNSPLCFEIWQNNLHWHSVPWHYLRIAEKISISSSSSRCDITTVSIEFSQARGSTEKLIIFLCLTKASQAFLFWLSKRGNRRDSLSDSYAQTPQSVLSSRLTN